MMTTRPRPMNGETYGYFLGSTYTHAHESVGGTPTIYVSKAVVVVQWQCSSPSS